MKFNASGSAFKDKDSIWTEDLLSQVGDSELPNKSGDTDSLLSLQSEQSHETLVNAILEWMIEEIKVKMFPKWKTNLNLFEEKFVDLSKDIKKEEV